MSSVQVVKTNAFEMATKTLENIQKGRQHLRDEVVERELASRNRPTFFKKLFKVKMDWTREEVLAYFQNSEDSSRGDCPWPGEFESIDNTYGRQEDVCMDVLRACKYADRYITIDLEDLRSIG